MHDLAEIVEVAFIGIFRMDGGVEFALQAVRSNLVADDIAFFEMGHHRLIRQGGDAPTAGDGLDGGDGQLAMVTRWVGVFR